MSFTQTLQVRVCDQQFDYDVHTHAFESNDAHRDSITNCPLNMRVQQTHANTHTYSELVQSSYDLWLRVEMFDWDEQMRTGITF